ncbi:MAG: antibiotic biosynthesis monooxygenase family protein [Micromonosporaceae bacterium]
MIENCTGTGSRGLFVVSSELAVHPDGADELIAAFRNRLGRVEHWEGFNHLEVWRDRARADRFVMTSWWASRDAFAGYMRSDDHRRSHARIPHGAAQPRLIALHRYALIAQ